MNIDAKHRMIVVLNSIQNYTPEIDGCIDEALAVLLVRMAEMEMAANSGRENEWMRIGKSNSNPPFLENRFLF